MGGRARRAWSLTACIASIGAVALLASAAGATSPAESAPAQPATVNLTEPGPAQRAGAEIDQAVADLRRTLGAWYGRTKSDASAAAAAASARARAWARDVRLEVWGDPDAATSAPRTLVARAVDPSSGAAWDPASGRAPEAAWVDLGAIKGGMPARAVVLVHGLDEPGSVWADLAPQLLRAGHAPVRYDYPNDGPAAAAADGLAASLRALRSAGVERVTIVGHSLGGLVGRDVATRPAYYAGVPDARGGLPRLDRLIIVAAPHAGAALACLEPVGEAREQLARRLDGTQGPGAGLLHSYADGRGEAAADLAPDSSFLRDLAARPAPRVPVTNIVARVLSPETCRSAAECAGAVMTRLGLDAPAPDSLEGLSRTLGDGIVSGRSADLPGCADTVVVAADHRSVIRRWHLLDGLGLDDDPRHPAYAPAIPVILDRLNTDSPRPSEPRP